MKLTTKEKILAEICRERGFSSPGNFTKNQIWEILGKIKAPSKSAMKQKLIEHFNFDAC